jgi:hypothetical protein
VTSGHALSIQMSRCQNKVSIDLKKESSIKPLVYQIEGALKCELPKIASNKST